MITIDIITTTRAEYGLMRPLIRRMIEDPEIQMNLLVTGTHLSEKFGNTYKEIEKDGFPITAKIPILGEGTGAAGLPGRKVRSAGIHHGDRSRNQQPERYGDGD